MALAKVGGHHSSVYKVKIQQKGEGHICSLLKLECSSSTAL